MYLAYNHSNLILLSQPVTKLEMPTNFISETYNEISNIQDKVNKINGPEEVQQNKFSLYSGKSRGFVFMFIL
jgi:hypothetical protein